MRLLASTLLPTAASICALVGLMSDTSPALEVSWGAAILFASVTVVVWAIGLRAYDPYRDRRHSPD